MLDAHLFPKEARFCFVRTHAETIDLYNYDHLHPLEKTIASNSVNSRRAEFGDSRWCAHQALADLGAPKDEPILCGERGMPLWPEGFIGSMTHTTGFRAAVVARTKDVRSLGLDAEPAEELPDNVLDAIARPGELAQLDRLRKIGVTCPDRLLFCAKEATYKAWFPMTHRWLDFDQAEIDLREDGTMISYLLTRPTPVPFIEGRWTVRKGFVIVATSVKGSTKGAFIF